MHGDGGALPIGGELSGPTAPDNYKRAVYRPPPSRFTVEMLSPTKQGNSYSFGMRICPTSIARVSLSSQSVRSSTSEYEVWRKWEDCLWFQESLEIEYSRLARAKRQRLIQGKGVKKNGMYLQDQAASFESLPPGPDPHSIAKDIHEFLPKLTKKGTLFRASQATIDQRYKELRALIDSLFQEDVPTLIKDLRSDRICTDFFGFWRRDHDLERKQKASNARAGKARASVSSSVFSSYFSASNPSLLDFSATMPPSPALTTHSSSIKTTSKSHHTQFTLRPPRLHDLARPSSTSDLPKHPSSAPADFRHTDNFSDDDLIERNGRWSSSSSGSSSTPSFRDSKGLPTPVVRSGETPIFFGHNPQQHSEYPGNDRPSSGLQSLPEDRELAVKTDIENYASAPARRRTENSAGDRQAHRNCQIFLSAPQSFDTDDDKISPTTSSQDDHPIGPIIRRSVRESWQTTSSSVSSMLDGLNVSLPHPENYAAGSRASVVTFMSDSSADAIIPRSPVRRSNSNGSRQYRPMSLSDDDLWSDLDDDIIDSYYSYDQFPVSVISSSESRLETPLGHLSSASNDIHDIPCFFASSQRSSITSTASSISSSPSSPTHSQDSASSNTLTIKAALNNVIIILRSSRSASFDEVRQRIHDKFVGQEGMSLSTAFTVAHLLPKASSAAVPLSFKQGHGRARSISLSSVTTEASFTSGTSVLDHTHMRFITSQLEWERVVAEAERGKLTLRILDTPS